MKVYVTDKDGKDLREHKDLTSVCRLSRGREFLRVDPEGLSPVTFVINGTARTEKISPFFLEGDVGGKPDKTVLPTGTYSLLVIQGPEHDPVQILLELLKTPVVAPAPKPVLSLDRKIVQPLASGLFPTGRGDGFVLPKRGGTLKNQFIFGHEQNIVIPENSAGAYLIQDVWSGMAWRDDIKKRDFTGQCLYAGEGDYLLDIHGFVGWLAGWAPEQSYREKNQFRHVAYVNMDGSLSMRNFILERGAAAGLKTMRSSYLEYGFISRCSVGISALYGEVVVKGVKIFGGGHHFDGSGFTGNAVCQTWCPVHFIDCDFIGAEQLVKPEYPLNKYYSTGMFNANNWHRQYNSKYDKGQYPDTPGGSFKFTNCRYGNWIGQLFNGTSFGTKPENVPLAAEGLTKVSVKPGIDAAVDAICLSSRKGDRPAKEYVQELHRTVESFIA